MTKYAIKTTLKIPGRNTMYVGSVRGGLPTYTDKFPLAKTFSTHAAANRFRRRHETAACEWTIVEEPSVAT